MHFALPPRRTSRPPPYAPARTYKPPFRRKLRLRAFAWVFGGAICCFFLLMQFRNRTGTRLERIPTGTPPVILITTLDPDLGEEYERKIVENRKLYAAKHGYETFFPNSSSYDLSDPPSPKSWARVPSVRHAMAEYPYSTYFFYLDQHLVIANPSLSLTDHVTSRLESLALLDQPIIPSSQVARTHSSQHRDNIDLILTQDHEGLRDDAFIVRRGEWAKYFLDAWFDPLYRSYNFPKAQLQALEHLAQGHPNVLERLALVPQTLMNSYVSGKDDEGFKEKYTKGDFVVNFRGCDEQGSERDCEDEAEALLEDFKTHW